ncbi:MAG: hypothetical protein Q9187_008273, partial [Circinaria calcarea]
VAIAFNLTHPGTHLPHEYATIGGGYKKAGFRQPAVKVADADQPTAGSAEQQQCFPDEADEHVDEHIDELLGPMEQPSFARR